MDQFIKLELTLSRGVQEDLDRIRIRRSEVGETVGFLSREHLIRDAIALYIGKERERLWP